MTGHTPWREIKHKKDQPATEPSQVTPKGYEIPVPTRDTVFSFFKKVARPKKD